MQHLQKKECTLSNESNEAGLKLKFFKSIMHFAKGLSSSMTDMNFADVKIL